MRTTASIAALPRDMHWQAALTTKSYTAQPSPPVVWRVRLRRAGAEMVRWRAFDMCRRNETRATDEVIFWAAELAKGISVMNMPMDVWWR